MKDDFKTVTVKTKTNDKPAKKRSFVKEAFGLVKQAALVLGGLAIAALGAYALYNGLHADSKLLQAAWIVPGACAVIDGIYVFVKGLKS